MIRNHKTTRLGLLLTGFALFLNACAGLVSASQMDAPTDTQPPTGTSIGQLAPDFSAATLDGSTLQLSDLRGQIVLLNVFASWCGPCRLEMPHLVGVYNQLASQGVAIVGLNLEEAPDTVASFQEEFGITFPIVLNQDGALTDTLYRPIGLPTTWFIDREGIVRYVFSGAMTQEVILNILDDIEAGRKVDPFS